MRVARSSGKASAEQGRGPREFFRVSASRGEANPPPGGSPKPACSRTQVSGPGPDWQACGHGPDGCRKLRTSLPTQYCIFWLLEYCFLRSIAFFCSWNAVAVLRFWFLEYSLLRSIAILLIAIQLATQYCILSILEYSFLRSILLFQSAGTGWLWPAALVDALAQSAGGCLGEPRWSPRTSGVRLRIVRLLVQSGKAQRLGGGAIDQHLLRAGALEAIPLRERPLSIRNAVESICSRCDSASRASALDSTCSREHLLSMRFQFESNGSRR